MKQELCHDEPQLPKLCEVAELLAPHTGNIQKLAKSPDCLLGEVMQPSYSRLNETIFFLAKFFDVTMTV